MGFQTKASGTASTAMGHKTEAHGRYSMAMGDTTKAIGYRSFAMGYLSKASGEASTAIGFSTAANGNSSFAVGAYTQATGNLSTAMGGSTIASGYSSTALGYETIASGDYSTAIGFNTIANGNSSFAAGSLTQATGQYSTAMGYKVSINGQKGSFVIGDSDPLNEGLTSLSEQDQFVARFKNGYFLLTSGNSVATRTGVRIGYNQTAWSSISDSTRKENFIKANGEEFLTKLKSLRLGSWNYKTTDTNPERFYGPMAQEIFSAYGKDPLGTIGSDTLVNTLNMDGLLFIFAQALEKRTESLKQENNDLKQTTASLKQENNAFQAEISSLKEKQHLMLVTNETLQSEISSLKLEHEQRLAKLENLLRINDRVTLKE